MKKPKTIAIYYPQFQSIPENDLAWGAGFTDWVNVKKAKPLFKGHYQPKVPINNNYYDLSNHEVLQHQVQLAKKYRIDGFCFYHYWFDGKLLLNKPVEQFLDDKSLDMSFCMSWANETWSKRWIGDTKTIIQLQEHKPDRDIWKTHFNYLLNFFLDSRYIKINNKPVFIIYQPILIEELNNLFDLWNELAFNNGFDGIYYIFTKRHDYLPQEILNSFDGIMKFQPQEVYNSNSFTGKGRIVNYLTNRMRFLPERIIDYLYLIRARFNTYKIYDSKQVWSHILKNSYKISKDFQGQIYESVYVNWDNTARYGEKATVFTHVSPSEFQNYFHLLYKEAIKQGSELLFINAWNEWAEGAYLEPDDKYGFEYLNAIRQIINSYD